MIPQFLDNFVANDDRGGKQAAIALSHAIAEVLKQITDRVMPLMIRVLGNPEWLSDAYYDANIIPNRANFGWFLEGFNSAEALVEFVAIDVRLTTPIYHMRGEL